MYTPKEFEENINYSAILLKSVVKIQDAICAGKDGKIELLVLIGALNEKLLNELKTSISQTPDSISDKVILDLVQRKTISPYPQTPRYKQTNLTKGDYDEIRLIQVMEVITIMNQIIRIMDKSGLLFTQYTRMPTSLVG